MIPMRTTKLDRYDFDLVYDDNGLVTQVIIFVDNVLDQRIANIASSLTDTDGNIYVSGYRLLLQSGFVNKDEYNQYKYILNVIDITSKEETK